MAFAVEQDEPPDPIEIALFRADGIMPLPNDLSNLIQEFHGEPLFPYLPVALSCQILAKETVDIEIVHCRFARFRGIRRIRGETQESGLFSASTICNSEANFLQLTEFTEWKPGNVACFRKTKR
jgi:hypothetical protein